MMDECCNSEELEEKFMKNKDDLQNLWEGFHPLWDYVEDGKKSSESYRIYLKIITVNSKLE